MSERDGYPRGTPCWAGLNTADLAAGQAFYGELFGWEWTPAGPSAAYGLLRGKKVAGIAAGPGPAWTVAFAVPDAAAAVDAAVAAGATVVLPVQDVPGQGRAAILLDPAGAAYTVWQAGGHDGAELAGEPGTVVWHELVTTDLAGAAEFYPAALGVDFVHLPVGDTGVPYGLVKVGGKTVAGALSRPPGTERVPPHWGVYFAVADAEAAADTAVRLGATLLSPVAPTPQGPMAALLDPQGAAFAILGTA